MIAHLKPKDQETELGATHWKEEVDPTNAEPLWSSLARSEGLTVVDDGGLVIWNDDSPLIAKNWSQRKKLAHTIAYGLTTLTVQLCTSVTSPAGEQISRELHVGTEVATLAFSVCVLGNIAGPPIFGPLSEMHGRKIGIFIPTFLSGLCLCVCANVTSISALVVFRFFTGVFGAAPIVSAVGAIGDMWSPAVLVTAVVMYACMLVLGAISAPIFGALLVETGNYGWRWACWLAALVTMILSVINMIFVSESYKPVKEQTAVRKLRIASGHWVLHVAHDKWNLSMKEFLSVHLARPIIILVTPIVLLMDIFAAFMYGIFYLLIESVGFEFQSVYHFTQVTSYLPLIGYFIGFLFGGAVIVVVSTRYVKMVRTTGRKPPPEERLLAMMLAGWFMPCGIFLYGWTMKPWIHWVVPIVGLGFIGAGFHIVFVGCLMYLIDNYPDFIASAIASNTIMRSIFGGVFPLFTIQMYKGLNVHWASSLLGFVCLALCILPFFFFLFGPKIRQHDPFKKHFVRT